MYQKHKIFVTKNSIRISNNNTGNGEGTNCTNIFDVILLYHSIVICHLTINHYESLLEAFEINKMEIQVLIGNYAFERRNNAKERRENAIEMRKQHE